jgi:hypothetical protein
VQRRRRYRCVGSMCCAGSVVTSPANIARSSRMQAHIGLRETATVSELCHMPPETPVKHRRLRGHPDAYQCCGKSLIGSALVAFGVRQHARDEDYRTRRRLPITSSDLVCSHRVWRPRHRCARELCQTPECAAITYGDLLELPQNCVTYPLKPRANTAVYGETPIHIVVAGSP